jgi:hypothetical protein
MRTHVHPHVHPHVQRNGPRVVDSARPGGGEVIQVDATLERLLVDVQLTVHAYLDASGEPERRALEQALARVDEHVARSDAYSHSFLDSPFLGVIGKGSVLGETSNLPFVELVPNVVLNAQVELVQRAKAEVQERSLTSLHALQSAAQSLEAARGPDTGG